MVPRLSTILMRRTEACASQEYVLFSLCKPKLTTKCVQHLHDLLLSSTRHTSGTQGHVPETFVFIAMAGPSLQKISQFSSSSILLVVHSFLGSFVHSFIRSFVHSFIRSFVHSFIRSFVHSFIRSFVHSFIRSFVHSFIRSFVHSFIRSFVHSFIRSFVHSFIRSFIIQAHPFIRCKRGAEHCGDCTQRSCPCAGKRA